MLNSIIAKISSVNHRLNSVLRLTATNCVAKFSAIPLYYRINDLMWQDGLLIDFLQKKVVDKWIRRFLVCSSYLFSERVLFKFAVRFYIDYVVWPATVSSLFEFSSVSLMLSAIVTSIIVLLAFFHLSYLYAVLFI